MSYHHRTMSSLKKNLSFDCKIIFSRVTGKFFHPASWRSSLSHLQIIALMLDISLFNNPIGGGAFLFFRDIKNDILYCYTCISKKAGKWSKKTVKSIWVCKTYRRIFQNSDKKIHLRCIYPSLDIKIKFTSDS